MPTALVLFVSAPFLMLASLTQLLPRSNDPWKTFPYEQRLRSYEHLMEQELAQLKVHFYRRQSWAQQWGSIKWRLLHDSNSQAKVALQYIDKRRNELGLPIYEARQHPRSKPMVLNQG
jgi:hypothetical protein